MTVNAITDTKKGRTGIAPTYLHTTPSDKSTAVIGLVVCLSGNELASIALVALRQTRLIPGWVTVCGRVNHLGM